MNWPSDWVWFSLSLGVWPVTSTAWFLHAERKFRLKNISVGWDKYDHLVGSLPRASVHLVLDLLEILDQESSYTALKEKFLIF